MTARGKSASSQVGRDLSSLRQTFPQAALHIHFSQLMSPHIGILLTAVTISIAQSQESEWLDRPGTVHVCEGRSAVFSWKCKNEIQTNLEIINFDKTQPFFKQLYDSTHAIYLKRLSVDQTNFTLDKVIKDDGGTYRLALYYDGDKNMQDVAQLVVIDKEACPNPEYFNKPVVSYKMDSLGREKRLNLDYINVTKEKNVSLLIQVPAAMPPVTCQITTYLAISECYGKSGEDFLCKMNIFTEDIISLKVSIDFKFVALPSSSRKIVVQRDLTGGTEELTITTEESIHTTSLPEEVISTTMPDLVTQGQQTCTSSCGTVGTIALSVVITLLLELIIVIYKCRKKVMFTLVTLRVLTSQGFAQTETAQSKAARDTVDAQLVQPEQVRDGAELPSKDESSHLPPRPM